MVNGEGETGRRDNGIDDAFAEAAAEITLVGGIHVAMEDARDVVAVIDADEFTAEGIAVAMFEENLFAGMTAGGIEIHGDVLAVKSQRGESDALGGLGLGDLDGRRVFNDFYGVAKGLLWIPELEAAQLGRAFDRNKRSGIVLDPKDTADGLRFLGMLGAATDGTVHANDGDVQFKDEAGIDGIGFFARIEIQRGTTWRSPIDRFLEGGFVDCAGVGRQEAEF